MNRQCGDEKSKYVVGFDPQPTGHVILRIRSRPYIAGISMHATLQAYICSLTAPILIKFSPNVTIPISGVGWGRALTPETFSPNFVYFARYDRKIELRAGVKCPHDMLNSKGILG